MNKAAINIFWEISFWYKIPFLLGKYLGVELLERL